MDINRGPRRARNVAANAAERERAGAGAQRLAARQAHQTPDQPELDSDDAPLPALRPNPFRLHRTARVNATPRLSMPLDSDDDSGSEPDVSILEMARRGRMAEQQQQQAAAATGQEMSYEEEDSISQQEYEAEDDMGLDEQVEDDEEVVDEQEEEIEPLVDPTSIGLKEISNLGKFTVSSHKPGNGVEELRSDNVKQYWQSDGPQPHKLTIYFVKRVGIRAIRFYIDYQEDESYTPTKIVFKSGTSENNLIEFATMNMENPYGWLEVPISGAGGDPDGNTLVSYVLQMQILENHQNGKDTHLRGIKIYAFDPDSPQGVAGQHASITDSIGNAIADAGLLRGQDGAGGTSDKLGDMASILASTTIDTGEAGFANPDFLREPEIR